jgi:hypothetical protein
MLTHKPAPAAWLLRTRDSELPAHFPLGVTTMSNRTDPSRRVVQYNPGPRTNCTSYTGNRMRNVVPFFGALLTSIFPR